MEPSVSDTKSGWKLNVPALSWVPSIVFFLFHVYIAWDLFEQERAAPGSTRMEKGTNVQCISIYTGVWFVVYGLTYFALKDGVKTFMQVMYQTNEMVSMIAHVLMDLIHSVLLALELVYGLRALEGVPTRQHPYLWYMTHAVLAYNIVDTPSMLYRWAKGYTATTTVLILLMHHLCVVNTAYFNQHYPSVTWSVVFGNGMEIASMFYHIIEWIRADMIHAPSPDASKACTRPLFFICACIRIPISLACMWFIQSSFLPIEDGMNASANRALNMPFYILVVVNGIIGVYNLVKALPRRGKQNKHPKQA